MDLLLNLRETEVISWSGKKKPSIPNRGVYPRPYQDPISVWIALGGTPQSAYQAGALGIPMVLAIIGGEPARMKSFADLYRRGTMEAGNLQLPLSINSHGFIAENS